MLNAPIGAGANIFLWIVCLGIGFLTAIVILDNLIPKKKEKKASK